MKSKTTKQKSKASDSQARNLCKFSSEFLHLFFNEQYPSNMTATYNYVNLLENLSKFIARESKHTRTKYVHIFSHKHTLL